MVRASAGWQDESSTTEKRVAEEGGGRKTERYPSDGDGEKNTKGKRREKTGARRWRTRSTSCARCTDEGHAVKDKRRKARSLSKGAAEKETE